MVVLLHLLLTHLLIYLLETSPIAHDLHINMVRKYLFLIINLFFSTVYLLLFQHCFSKAGWGEVAQVLVCRHLKPIFADNMIS